MRIIAPGFARSPEPGSSGPGLSRFSFPELSRDLQSAAQEALATRTDLALQHWSLFRETAAA